MARFIPPRHGRTHCPGGSDPIPCLEFTRPWFRQSLTFAGSDSPLNVGNLDSETLIYDAVEFGDGGDTYFDVMTSPDRFQLIGTNMWVGLTAEVWWNDTPEGEVQFLIHDGGSVPAGFSMNPLETQDGATHAVRFEWRASGTPVEIKVANLHPTTDRTVLAAYVELHYLGSWTGTDPHDSDPDF